MMMPGLVLFALITANGNVPVCAADLHNDHFTEHAFQGTGQWSWNASGDLTIVLNADTGARETTIHRFAPVDPSAAENLFPTTGGQASELTIDEWRGHFFRDIEVTVQDSPERKIHFRIDTLPCMPESTIRDTGAAEAHRLRATSVTRLRGNDTDLQRALAPASQPLLRPISELSIEEKACPSGGPGAAACSVDFGSFGPQAVQESGALCLQPAYACCGNEASPMAFCVADQTSNGARQAR
ncbi:hypothetical protein [Wenzhouxiangella marina]|uniref:Uncharacterized protein n=1 Tax=Wenzhouxiangella marina TaxID=1579979 RepID=A0A0K0XU96_9GAMM|nr:hypothetical protein [Wenzhouxiangella marina]AKS41235.1 hypothetical protein WM2015_854 [Wenzhouxiangella marina]MBB6088115.1 hypothetical protein [Wenzhouxiangella marina]